MNNKRTAKSAVRALPPIEVILTVVKFNDVLRAGKLTTYTMNLARKHPIATIKGDNIVIFRPGAWVRFTIASSRADKNQYYPVGITFLRDNSAGDSDAKRLGFVNFPQNDTRPAEQTLAINDIYADMSWPVRYKFSVVVQRGADGKIGIIDPGIVHEDEVAQE